MGTLLHLRNCPGLGSLLKRELAAGRQEIRQGGFQRSMGIMTIFAATVTGFESYTQHQRGAFSHWAMWTPVLLTPPTVVLAGAGLFREWIARQILPLLSLAWLVDGVIGFLYHLRGVGRLPGGFRLGQYNVVIGPPIFAPLLACTVGVLGLMGSVLRRGRFPLVLPLRLPDWMQRRESITYPEAGWLPKGLAARMAHGRFQQGLALTAAFFALLAGGEAYFEHLRGSFNQRFMWIPVWITFPMVVVALLSAASGWVARHLLPAVSMATMLVGWLGALLHLRGLKDMPGGIDSIRYAVTMGPPLFAPLLFSSTGLLGILASLLRRREE